MNKYITFKRPTKSDSGKTKIWKVAAMDGWILGVVKWDGRWRKYAFLMYGESIFEEGCLREIADFCEKQTNAQHKRRRAAAAPDKQEKDDGN